MAWEKFEKFGGSYSPKISIRVNGQIGFSTGALNRFGINSYNYCEIHYDAERKCIGFRLTNASQEGVTAKIVRRDIDCFVSAKTFLDYYGIDYRSSTKSYLGTKDEESGFIVIDLNNPFIIHGKKGKHNKGGDNAKTE